MTDRPKHSAGQSLRQRLQALIRNRLWQMDIAPSAWIAETALVDRTYPKGVHIGERCVFDHESVLLTHDRTRGLYLDTRIGAGTYVGPRAIILPGVTVGENCHIEPGALVSKDCPAGTRIRGNPGRIVQPD